jgi:DNA topoisomerase-6 subunit B
VKWLAFVDGIAEELAKDMKAISIAEFFEKNRHLLGYENSTKALITIVKEGVDNSLDVCNEAGILPDIDVTVKQIGIDRFKIVVEDNGPGIVESKLPYTFGKLLFGSKFHRLRQSRGTQGIGIKGAILYSQLTTGKPAIITSSTGDSKIHIFKLFINTVHNEPNIVSHETMPNKEKWHGIKVELETEGKYIERSQSVPEYLKQTAIANPYAKIIYDGPNGKQKFDRSTEVVPKQPKEIKPHPYGIELGVLRRMATFTRARNVIGFLMSDFSRVGRSSAMQICRLAKVEPSKNPKNLSNEEYEQLHKAMQMVKLIAPPTDCLSPLTNKLIEDGLKKEVEAEYYVAITRPPTVYRGNPFQVEVGIAYGGKLVPNESCIIYRFANKVPLLYHQSSCAVTEAIQEVDWRRYGLQQSTGSLPVGPAVILVHFASVWVPFTSEGKEAIAKYPEIMKEIKLALQDAGRQMYRFVSHKRRNAQRQLRRQIFERYIPEVAAALSALTEKDKNRIIKDLEGLLQKNNKEIEAAMEEAKGEEIESGEDEGEA